MAEITTATASCSCGNLDWQESANVSQEVVNQMRVAARREANRNGCQASVVVERTTDYFPAAPTKPEGDRDDA